jgi:hypothetical protein
VSEGALCCCSAATCVQAQSTSVPGWPKCAHRLQQQEQWQSRRKQQQTAARTLWQHLQRRQPSKHQQPPLSRLTSQKRKGAQACAGLPATQEPPRSVKCMGHHTQPHSRASQGAQTRSLPLNLGPGQLHCSTCSILHTRSCTLSTGALPHACLPCRNSLTQCWEVRCPGGVSTADAEARSTDGMMQEVRPAQQPQHHSTGSKPLSGHSV